MKRVYVLKAIEDHPKWDTWYDKCHGAVIVASSEKEARELFASTNFCGDEGKGVWLDDSCTECKEIDYKEEGVVLVDFRNA